MPKFYSAEKPRERGIEELTGELREYPELKPRLAFLWPLGEGRQNALEILESEEIIDLKKVEKLLESGDFIEREAGLYILGNVKYSDKSVSENLKSVLDKIYEEKLDSDYEDDARDSVARVKMNILVATQKEAALPKIKKTFSSGTHFERLAAIEALYFGGLDERKSLSFLKGLVVANNDLANETIAETAGIFGEKSLPLLDELAGNANINVRVRAIKTKIEVLTKARKEKLLPFLEEMVFHEDWRVRLETARAAKVVGLAAAPLLEKLSKDKAFNVSEKAKLSLALLKSGQRKWLLSSRKSIFASLSTKDLAENLAGLGKIVDDMKENFKDDFVGVMVVGSINKGYFSEQEGSDVDVIVIAKGKKEVNYFIDSAAGSMRICYGLDVCFGAGHIGIDDRYGIKYGNPSGLFYGIFLGDRQKLLKLQKKVLENEDNNGWDKIRMDIVDNETSLGKAARRFDIRDSELEKIKQFVALLKIPPPLEEAQEILNKR